MSTLILQWRWYLQGWYCTIPPTDHYTILFLFLGWWSWFFCWWQFSIVSLCFVVFLGDTDVVVVVVVVTEGTFVFVRVIVVMRIVVPSLEILGYVPTHKVMILTMMMMMMMTTMILIEYNYIDVVSLVLSHQSRVVSVSVQNRYGRIEECVVKYYSYSSFCCCSCCDRFHLY